MLAMEKNDDLLCLVVGRAKDKQNEALESFCHVMLLRESLDT